MKSIFVILALSIAMVGAAIAVPYGALQAEAAKSGTSIQWCYESAGATPGVTQERCFPNHGECVKAQESDTAADSGCFKRKS